MRIQDAASHVKSAVRQINVPTVYGLVQLLAASPALAGSTLLALLVTALVEWVRARNLS
jgi:hypothetical protein